MLRRSRFILGLALALVSGSLPAHAARPILDYHRLDAYFSLFAHDSNVPWKPTSVRLDTYSSAPVDFRVYQVDPADVIVAGSNTRPRAIDTRSRRPVASWRYTPPGGFRFQTNDVTVPLGSREGFFVVEARRGSVGEQVWINRTRVGLLTKETPGGIALYGADLGTGRPLQRMRVSFIANGRFTDRYTDKNGIVFWRGNPRPVFALAQWGSSSAFVSFLPQAPLPPTIVGMKTDSAVVHAGDTLHIVGFARSRSGSRLRAASGTATIVLRSPWGWAAQTSARLDSAGAFTAALRVPENSRAGDYTAIATIGGGTAGTSVRVDANAGDLAIALAAHCQGACDPDADVPLQVRASRGGVAAAGIPVNVTVIRSPHAYAGDAANPPWGIARWFQTTVRTGSDGTALVMIPHPSDGLASTYGVQADSGGATADTRIIVPTAPVMLRISLESDDIGSGTPAVFDVSGTEIAGGRAAAGLQVRVQLTHGASVQEQTVTLNAQGMAHGSFRSPQAGSNLIVALANAGSAQAMDAAQIQVEPQTLQTQSAQSSRSIAISLDRKRYGAGESARIDASLPGSAGSAVLTLESASGTDIRVVPVRDGRASASIRVADAPGVLSAGAAFVRDGSLQWDSVPLVVDAPGRPLAATLQLDKAAYVPGSIARAQLGGVRGGEGTLIVRLTKGAPTGSAVFETAPDLLAIGTTATQDTAADGASWHPWVDSSSGGHAVIQTFARRSAPPSDLALTQADTASVYWKVDRTAGDAFDVPVPETPGKYVLTLLKIGDDGRVTAAASDLVVR